MKNREATFKCSWFHIWNCSLVRIRSIENIRKVYHIFVFWSHLEITSYWIVFIRVTTRLHIPRKCYFLLQILDSSGGYWLFFLECFLLQIRQFLPSNLVLSWRKSLYPSPWNWAFEKQMSSLLLNERNTSISFKISSLKSLSFFLKEFYLDGLLLRFFLILKPPLFERTRFIIRRFRGVQKRFLRANWAMKY